MEDCQQIPSNQLVGTPEAAPLPNTGRVSKEDSRTLCPHTNVPDCLHTCVHPYHAEYSKRNLPPLIFRLDAAHIGQQSPLGYLVEHGQVVKDAEGVPLRDFTFLPRYISVRAPGWLLEYWMRTDTRLTYRDIKARMTAPENELPLDNTLNMRREREARTPLNLSCLTTRRGQIARKEVERVEGWTPDQVSYNTAMVIEYRNSGEKRVPFRLRSKTLVPAPPKFFALDTFLENGQLHVPSRRIKAAIDLFYQLSEAAAEQKLRTWEVLPSEYLPSSWRPRSFPTRLMSGKRRRYPAKGIIPTELPTPAETILEDDDPVVHRARTEVRGDDIAGASEVSYYDDEADYDAMDEEEHVKFSGLPKVVGYQDLSNITGVADHHHAAERSTHGRSSGVSTVILPWTPINRPQSHKPSIEESENADVVFAAAPKTARATTSTLFGTMRRRESLHRTFSPFQSSANQQAPYGHDSEEMDIEADTNAPGSRVAEPVWFNRYRFNGSGARSIHNDKSHALNTKTLEVMRRNNPFSPENMDDDSVPAAVEKYFTDSMKRFEGGAYPSP